MKAPLNRRQFLEGTAATGALLGAGWPGGSARAGVEDDWPKPPPVKIFKLYAGRTGDLYLTRPTEELGKIDAYLEEVARKLGDVEFVGGDMIPPAKVEELAPKVQAADALLVIPLSHHGGSAPVIAPLVELKRPTALFSQPFSGHHWMDFPQWHKQGRPIVLMPTSDWKALDQAVALLRVPARMRQTKILAIGRPNGTAAACAAEKVKDKLGAELVTVPNERVMEYMKAVDPAAAEAEAKAYWLDQAKAIVEPTVPEIIASARLYLATKRLMLDEKAQAVCSVHCMGDPRGCLTFSKLNDLGLVGACEGDIDSTLTMLLFGYAFGVPGFITDPVIDTAKNAVVHFHCTSATKLDGPGGKRLPFTIRNQTDTKGGVALQVENRVGQAVTCAKLASLDTMLMIPGTITETSTSPLACRTQFAQQVRDARRLFLEWGANVLDGDTMTRLHRVVFYGDYMKPMQDLCDLMGLKMVEEGGVAV